MGTSDAPVNIITSLNRDDLVSKYAERRIVKFFLIFQDNPRALIFLISLILACIIVTVLLYTISVTYIMVSVIKNNADWEVIVKTFVATLIVITNFIVVKYFKIDDYIRGGILESLFIVRSNGIKRGEIQDVHTTSQPPRKAVPAILYRIMNVIGKSRYDTAGETRDNEPVMEHNISNFTINMIAHPFLLCKNKEEKEDIEEELRAKAKDVVDFLYVFTGVLTYENNVDNCKMYRFCVNQSNVTQLWSYLKKMTQFLPRNCMRMWQESNVSHEQQAQQIYQSISLSIDSGFGSLTEEQRKKLYTSEFSLYLDDNNIWQCSDKNKSDSRYIYFMIKKLPTLKEVADKYTDNNARFCARNIKRLLNVARYIKKLHDANTVHGNITMRNILLIPVSTGLRLGEADDEIFITTECFFFLQEQLKSTTEDGKKRRKFFDAEQREDPSNVTKATDVFAFGLCMIELLCTLTAGHKSSITKNIRRENGLDELLKSDKFKEFHLVRDTFGALLGKIFKPRAERATIDDVINDMKKIKIEF